MLRRILLLAIAVLLTIGCKKAAPPPPAKSKTGETDADAAAKKKPKAKRPAPVKRTSMEGNWVVQSLRMDLKLPPDEQLKWQTMGLLNISKKENGQYNVSLVQGIDRSGEVGPYQFLITDKQARIIFVNPRIRQFYHFQVVLDETTAIGSLNYGTGPFSLPARFIATDAKSLDGFGQSEATPNAKEFEKLMKSRPPASKSPGDKPAATMKELREFIDRAKMFVRKHPDDPLAFFAESEILTRLFKRTKEEVSDEEFQKELDEYFKLIARWQPPMQQHYREYYAQALFTTNRDRQIIIKLMKDAEAAAKLLGMDGMATARYEAIRERAEIELAAKRLKSEDKTVRDEAAKKLKQMVEVRSFHPLIYFAFAQDAEKRGDLDEAIANYAEIVAVPQMIVRLQLQQKTLKQEPTPVEEKLNELWKKKHGDTKGLPEYLDKVYLARVAKIAKDKVEPRPTGKHAKAVLCELFTNGAVFDPDRLDETLLFDSAPMELALDAISDSYAITDVITLRYHMDHPLIKSKTLDPLVNEDSESRAFEFKVGRPPALFVNGAPSRSRFGNVEWAKLNYQQLRIEIDRDLDARSSPPSLKLNVVRQGDDITISATAGDLPEVHDDLRLLLVLAEQNVEYLSRNRVRFHEMLVRHMPGGTTGAEPKGGKIEASEMISISGLKRKLLEFLTAHEQRQTEDRKFPSKPMQLKDLHVVAFVYDRRTMKVLQATSSPVDGPAPKRPKPKPAKPATAKKPKSATSP